MIIKIKTISDYVNVKKIKWDYYYKLLEAKINLSKLICVKKIDLFSYSVNLKYHSKIKR